MPSEDDNVIEGPWPALTDEEVRILKLVSEGRSTQEIADELGMSYSTVRRKSNQSSANCGTGHLEPPPDV
jgi:DNA-binding NarL/FixJ family response regulator